MRIDTFLNDSTDTRAAAAQAQAAVADGAAFVFAAVNADHDPNVVRTALRAAGAVHGASSCMGAMTQEG
ncbi:MAG: hypothetical protein AAF218_06750, partial [Pseudomonadota bacterium]